MHTIKKYIQWKKDNPDRGYRYNEIKSDFIGGLTPGEVVAFLECGEKILIVKNGLDNLFIENEEILAYSNTDELNKKIQIVQNDKDFAEYLCNNARIKTKANYGIINRVKRFQKIIDDISK